MPDQTSKTSRPTRSPLITIAIVLLSLVAMSKAFGYFKPSLFCWKATRFEPDGRERKFITQGRMLIVTSWGLQYRSGSTEQFNSGRMQNEKPEFTWVRGRLIFPPSLPLTHVYHHYPFGFEYSNRYAED